MTSFRSERMGNHSTFPSAADVRLGISGKFSNASSVNNRERGKMILYDGLHMSNDSLATGDVPRWSNASHQKGLLVTASTWTEEKMALLPHNNPRRAHSAHRSTTLCYDRCHHRVGSKLNNDAIALQPSTTSNPRTWSFAGSNPIPRMLLGGWPILSSHCAHSLLAYLHFCFSNVE